MEKLISDGNFEKLKLMTIDNAVELFAYNYAINRMGIIEYFQGGVDKWDNHAEIVNRAGSFHSSGQVPNLYIEGGLGATRRHLTIDDPLYIHVFREYSKGHQAGDGGGHFTSEYSDKFAISAGGKHHTSLKYVNAEVCDNGQPFLDKSHKSKISSLAKVKTE